MSDEATFDDFTKLDIRVGRIVAVEDFPRARNPSWRVTLDLGPELGERKSSMQATNYPAGVLDGMLVVCVVNFPPRNIAGFMSEVLVLGTPGEDDRISLLTPSRPAVVGGRIY